MIDGGERCREGRGRGVTEDDVVSVGKACLDRAKLGGGEVGCELQDEAGAEYAAQLNPLESRGAAGEWEARVGMAHGHCAVRKSAKARHHPRGHP
jgi:hypothetical protein